MVWLILVSIVWAFSFGVIRSSLSDVDPSLVSFLRLALATLAAAPLLRAGGIPSRLRGQLILTGAVQFGMMYLAYIRAFEWLEAWEVAMLTITTPVFVALFDAVAERRLNRVFLAAACAAVLGGGIILWGGSPASPGFLKGLVLVQASNLFFAAGQVFYRSRMSRYPGLSDAGLIGLLYLGGIAATAVPAAASIGSVTRLSGAQLLSLGYLGLVSTAACFLMWNRGARLVNAGSLAAMNNAKIPLAVLASLVFFGERPDPERLITGFVLIAGGVAASRLLSGRSPGARGTEVQ